MERKSNITVWQLRLFEGFDKDVMVMQRDEEEVFDNALHVFFDKEYYDAYVSKAKKYSNHRYAYHEDKLGEVIYQVFDEKVAGLVLHITPIEQGAQNYALCEEKYLSAKDLRLYEDYVESYHYLYTASIERMPKEEAIANMWNKNVFIIGHLPDLTKAKDEKQTIELMTLRRKKDGTPATAEDYDYESLKVFLTAESAMRFNPDKKPINRYRLSLLSQFVKGKLQIVIEPHRNYWVEYDPATIDISNYYKKPEWNEEKVKARINEYAQMAELYILLATNRSDYRSCVGTPLLVKMAEDNVMMYLFEKYDDAVRYVIENPAITPVFDGVYPIGVLKKADRIRNLHTMLAVANASGVHTVNMDMDTDHSIGCKIPYFLESVGLETALEKVVTAEDYEKLKSEKDGKPVYRLPVIPFVQQDNEYRISEERKEALQDVVKKEPLYVVTYAATCTLPEKMYLLNQIGLCFDAARQAEDEETKKKYNKLMNMMTVPIADSILEKPFIYTLREEDGSFTLKNKLAYLLITNRFEAGRGGAGKLTPASVDNENFMEKLEEVSKVAVLTDGPDVLCLIDVHLLSDVVKQRKKAESLMEEMLIFMTQGLDMPYAEALSAFNRLKLDNDIFVEFVSYARNGQFPPMGMLTYAGYDAKKIVEEKGCNPVEAYMTLLDCKLDPENIKISVAETATTETEPATDTSKTEEEGKTSFFGKLFKK